MSIAKRVLSWLGWIVAVVLAIIHFRRKPEIIVTPDKVEAPPGQDMSDTLPVETLEEMRSRIAIGK